MESTQRFCYDTSQYADIVSGDREVTKKLDTSRCPTNKFICDL